MNSHGLYIADEATMVHRTYCARSVSQEGSPARVVILLLAAIYFLIVVVAIYILSSTGVKMVRRSTPQVNASMDIKYETSLFHLWLEEAIHGNISVTKKDLWKHLDQAEWYARALLEGGVNVEGTIAPLDEQKLRTLVEVTLSSLAKLSEIARKRLENIKTGITEDTVDTEFNNIFAVALEHADKVERKVREHIGRQLGKFRFLYYLITISIILLGVGVGFTFLRYERKRTEAEHTNAVLATFFDNIADPVEVTNTEAKIEYVNSAFEKVTGYTVDEVFGMTPADLLSPGHRDTKIYDGIWQTISAGEVWRGGLREVRKDGSEWHADTTISPVFSKADEILNFVSIKRDTTRLVAVEDKLRQAHRELERKVDERTAELRRKIAERISLGESLRSSEERYRGIFDSASVAIALINLQGRYIQFNEAWMQMLGYGEDELKSITNMDVTHPDDKEKTRAALGDLMSGKIASFHIEKRFIRKTGEICWGELSASPIHDSNGSIVSVIGVCREITKRKIAENKLREAKERADLASLAKSRFIANTSHELRTPLNAILGFSEVMKDEIYGAINNDKYLEYAVDIHNSANYLLKVINDILDVSKIEAGTLTSHEDKVDVKEIITSSVKMIREQADRGKIELSCETAKNLPELFADSHRVKQIFINILSNAVKFTPAGGDVRVLVYVDDKGGINLCVRDSGIGIPPEDIVRVMEPFERGGDVFTRSYEGTGLGLSMSKSMMEIHSGKLVIESKVGSGTTVTAIFPPERTIVK